MGNSDTKSGSVDNGINISDFRLEQVIGRGGFGKVWRVRFKSTKQRFALKEMLKTRVIQKKSVVCVMNERKILAALKHPFIVNMIYAFQDKLCLYLVMDLMPGGDLRYHLCKNGTFDEKQTKFFVCCILMGLEYLHINGYIHRDIKPENLVFDNKGYLRITDFGIASSLSLDNSKDTSGTPGYMSPEVMNHRQHGAEADYFALGVIAYECMLGRRPYFGKNRREIREQLAVRQVQLKKNDVPSSWSLESADFINKLIQRNPKQRLGANGPQEIKNHAWLLPVEWKKHLEKRIEPPYKITSSNNVDPNASSDWRDEHDSEIDIDLMQGCFMGYQFDNNFLASTIKSTRVLKNV